MVEITFVEWKEHPLLAGICIVEGKKYQEFCESGRISTWLLGKKYFIYGQTEQEYLLKIVLEIFLVV